MSAELTRQIVVRLDEELYRELEQAAERNERTVAQEVRFRLRGRTPHGPITFPLTFPNTTTPQPLYWWQVSPTCGADGTTYKGDPNVIVTNGPTTGDVS